MSVELARSHNATAEVRPWSKYSKGSSAYDERERDKKEYKSKLQEERDEVAKVSEMRKARKEAMAKGRKKAAKMLAEIYGTQDDEKLAEFMHVSTARSSAKTWSNDDSELLQAQKKMQKVTEKQIGGGARVRVDTVDAKRPAVDGVVYSRTHISFGDDVSEAKEKITREEEEAESDSEYEDMPLDKKGKDSTNEQGKEDSGSDSDGGDDDASEKAAITAATDADYLKSLMSKKDIAEEEDMDMGDVSDGEMEVGKKSKKSKKSSKESTQYGSAHDGKQTEVEAIEALQGKGAESSNMGSSGTDTKADPDASAKAAADWEAGLNEIHSSRRMGAVGTGGIVATDALVANTGRIFVRNLPFACTELELEKLFKKFGPLTECHMPLDKDTKKPKGVAFVTFVLPEHAVRAMEVMDKHVWQGRLMHILPARPRAEEKKEEESKAGSSYKKKSEADRKSKAGAEYTWNTLFMRSDTVAAALAAKMKINKSDLLSRDADSMAVRMALGETHIIQETKAYLLAAGLRLEAFEGTKKRSNTVIIVKNIPYDITEEDLKLAFDPFGTLGRIVLPPTRTIALVEFAEPSEAREAFRRLAYTKFKSVPLYLEWAPQDTFISAADEVNGDKGAHAGQADESDGEGESVETSNDRSIFVKNLNFDTTDESLKSLFEKAGSLRSARVAKKNVNGKSLSMGFGFLEFTTKDGAANCLKTLQHVKLDGHTLDLKWAREKGSSGATTEVRKVEVGKAKSNKLMIRNMPFEATKKEVRELFQAFGKLKSVRVPKKFDGTSRGFGFVEFVSKSEAKNAFESLKTTHFYGRHLVLEWADEEMSVEQMREHTLKHYVDGEQGGRQAKRTKVEM
ncbi:hypothetical protein SARC_08914 [Sphaeroforma arctica JP610]|uniref:RRM domain-containing protein n=1 Tax=Sphaeroforma arctica JP610 TaxID=667725 RepID=A0A0L0FQ64_9EUKA|nr:hypothetical protein SARC_08914 [Sphaeroforma arctica JP610]KNC78666.1 hypothetical protein SARC_08914 [Sphaeroforma arctica JP610]|eukprot:XP_014152568.1 hypothetical protein SARC_08914 [Sphaeroforma arctica JP610]